MRPRRQPVTFVIDGIEVTAPEGEMLVDAAKRGDIEIPVFCYEPKLGEAVGACRMCLVEVEGLPKLQTACSMPVRDGMVVYTSTEQAVEGQNAVVEFLLANHPLDCPVCDKGGECPLQDISMGWGRGRSRFTDPKRHFQKPLPLSPLIAIDRERCILCYRCVRFSQDVSEDEQLQLLDRAAETYVGTFGDRPYVAPFHGNITELCPVGALTSRTYRFRARPWDIEDAGTVCTLCPAQCNVKLTVRDERVMRVLARDNPAVDDGWLCDKGRYGFQLFESPERLTDPLIGDEPAGWEETIAAAAQGLRAAEGRVAALVGGATSNEEGWLVQRILRQALGSPHIDSRPHSALDRETLVALSSPELQATVADIDHAGAVLVVEADPLNDAPVLDLRIRKAVRHGGARLVVATDRPTPIDGGAVETIRYAPGEAAAFLTALAAALGAEGHAPDPDSPYTPEATAAAETLRAAEDAVILFAERLTTGQHGAAAARALLACTRALDLHRKPECGLLEIPSQANGRGLREVGCLPIAAPGLTEPPEPGLSTEEIRDALESRDLDAVLLVNTDPIRDLPNAPAWERALRAARHVVAVTTFPTASSAYADVLIPAETHAEKDGTVTHFDGRLQRLRPGTPHPGRVRRGWQVLLELSAALDKDPGLASAAEIYEAIQTEVSFYAGIDLDAIAGQGRRWPDSAAAPPPQEQEEALRAAPDEGSAGSPRASAPDDPSTGPAPTPSITLATYRDLWAAEPVEQSPALEFLVPQQRLELSPADAERLGVNQGDEVEVSTDSGEAVKARVMVRERMRPGAAFMIAGTREDNANRLIEGAPPLVEVRAVEAVATEGAV